MAWPEMDYLIARFEDAHPFGRATVKITDSTGVRRSLDVEVADSHETRARGMVGRAAFEADGMLFAYDDDVHHAFHMNGVNVQVHIAWFNAAGECIDHVGMFTKDPWHYQPNAAYRWAIELPVTDGANFSWLDAATLTL